MGYVDIKRVQRLLESEGLDGLLVVSPEDFAYFAGTPGFPVTMWRRGGPASAFVSAHGDAAFVVPDLVAAAVESANPGAALLTYPIWADVVDVRDADGSDIAASIAAVTAQRPLARAETIDQLLLRKLLADAAVQVGIANGRIGIELEWIPASDLAEIQSALPHATFVNSSPLIRKLRAVKTLQEIEYLRQSVRISEQGIRGSLVGIDDTTIANDIRQRFVESAAAFARSERITGYRNGNSTVNLGPLLYGYADPFRTVRRGDNIQFDSAVSVNGYYSDIARTFVYGEPTDAQRRIEDALLDGYNAGLAKLKPGNTFSDVHAAAQNAVRAAGFPTYTRGHVGHSIGSDIVGEEWPFFSATETSPLEPGMVLAFEVPYYVQGVGGFQNEDNILITDSGYESFNALPHGLNLVA